MNNVTDTVDYAAEEASEYVASNPEDTTTADRLYILKAYALYETLKAKASLLSETVNDLQHFAHFNKTIHRCFSLYVEQTKNYKAMLDYITPVNTSRNAGADNTVNWIHLMEQYVTDYKTALVDHIRVSNQYCPDSVKTVDINDYQVILMHINEVLEIISDMLELVYAIHDSAKRVSGDMPQSSTRCIFSVEGELPPLKVIESFEDIYSIVPDYEYISIMDNRSNAVDRLLTLHVAVHGNKAVR